MNFVKLSAQHEFPIKDISDENAEILEFLLLNPDIINNSHLTAEAARYLYSAGHLGLNAVATHYLEDPARRESFSEGIKAYEAMSCMVQPSIIPEDEAAITLEILTAQHLLSRDFGGTLSDASSDFYTDMPRAAVVIGESAARFSMNRDYAIAGAAIARQIELGTLN
jgi:hypothetical protein